MAGGPIRLKVTVEGHRELMAKLRADTLLAAPWKGAMERIGTMGLSAARAAAPSGPSGRTKALLISKVQQKPIPKWVAVRSTAKRSSRKYKNYRYPRRLEYDPKSRHRGWLQNAIRGVYGRISGILGGAAREIEGKWRA